jgi:replicative DNA helicase
MIELEKSFLHEVTRDEKIVKLAIDGHVTEAYFQYPETKLLFRIIKYNFDRYSQVLRTDTLQSLLRVSQRMTPEDQSQVTILLEEVKLLPDCSDFNVLLDEFTNYYKITCIKNSLEASVSFLADKNPDKALDRLKSDIVSLERAINTAGLESGYFGENHKEMIFKYLDSKNHPEKYKGIELGYRTIDNITNGLPKNTVTIIMGSPKSAKSVLLVNVAYHNLLLKKRIYYHVNEGGKEMVENRLACRATGLIMDRIERRQLSDAEFQTYTQFLESISKTKQIYIDSVPRSLSSISYIERKVKDLEIDGAVDLVIVDYMSIMSPDDKTLNQGWEKIGAVAMDLKNLAAKLNVPILTIMHVNADGLKSETAQFEMHQMGLSREPLKHVDLIMSWKINDQEELDTTRQGQGVLTLSGSRFCGSGKVTLNMNTNIMKISEYDLNRILH